jgi:hypothetical protein
MSGQSFKDKLRWRTDQSISVWGNRISTIDYIFVFFVDLERTVNFIECGAAQIVVRRPAVRRARVRIPARHPNGDPSTERKR